MTVTEGRPSARSSPSSPAPEFLAQPPPQRADGATLVLIYLVAQMIIPARSVIRGLPISLTPANIVGLLMALLWLLSQFTTTLGAAKGRNAVRTALFCFFFGELIVYGYATSGYLPGDELNLADHALVLVLSLLGVGLAIVDGVRGHNRLDLVLRTVVVCGAIIAAIGALQYLFTIDLTRYLALPGLRFTADDGFVTSRNAHARVSGTTGHPIEFGVMCAMLLPLAVHFGMYARSSGRPALRWWVCAGLIAAGLMFSVSRSAILGVASAGLVMMFGWSGRRRLNALGVVAAFLVAMKIAVPGLMGTFVSLFTNIGNDSSIQARTHDYATASAEIAAHTWFGRGLGTWYAPKHEVFDNQYLLTLVETGVIGLVALLLVFVVGIYAAARARTLTGDPELRDLGLSLCAGLIVPLLGMATFDLMAFATVTGLTFVYAGVGGALLRNVRADPVAAPTSPRSGRAR